MEELTKPISYLLYIPTIYTYHIYTYTYHISYHITQPCSALRPCSALSRPGCQRRVFQPATQNSLRLPLLKLTLQVGDSSRKGLLLLRNLRVLGVLGSSTAQLPVGLPLQKQHPVRGPGEAGDKEAQVLGRVWLVAKQNYVTPTVLLILHVSPAASSQVHQQLASLRHGLPVHSDKCALQHRHDHRQ